MAWVFNEEAFLEGAMLKYLLVSSALIALPLVVEQPPAVPAGLLAATQQEPLAFAMSLADASVPNGLETSAPVQRPVRKPDFDLGKQATATVDQVVDAFNLHHGDYRASLVDGVVVIRPATNRAAYLDLPSTLEPTVVTGLMSGVRSIFAGLDPRVAAPGGIAGSGLPADERGDFNTVSLDGHGRSIVGVLNQLAKQSGRGWFVVTTKGAGGLRVRSFGLIHRHGSISQIDLD